MNETGNRNDTLREEVSKCPDYLYAWSPSGRASDTRFAFQLRTCLSLAEAVDYARGYAQRLAQSARG